MYSPPNPDSMSTRSSTWHPVGRLPSAQSKSNSLRAAAGGRGRGGSLSILTASWRNRILMLNSARAHTHSIEKTHTLEDNSREPFTTSLWICSCEFVTLQPLFSKEDKKKLRLESVIVDTQSRSERFLITLILPRCCFNSWIPRKWWVWSLISRRRLSNQTV